MHNKLAKLYQSRSLVTDGFYIHLAAIKHDMEESEVQEIADYGVSQGVLQQNAYYDYLYHFLIDVV